MWLIFWSNNLVTWTSHSFTSKLTTSIHWFINHAIKIVFILFVVLLVIFNWWRSVSGSWLNLFNNFLIFRFIKIIDNHRFFYSLSLQFLHLLSRYWFPNYSLLCVNCHKIFVFDFIKMICLTQIHIFRNISVTLLNIT